MFNSQEIDKILKIKGEVRGVVFHTDAKYILENKGEEGLKAVNDNIKKINLPISYGSNMSDIKATSWYPLSWRILSLLIIKDTFGWQDKDIIAMGEAAPKYSFIVKVLLRYFISLEKTFSETGKYWEKHYSIGKLLAPIIDVKNKHLVIQLHDFKIHKITCVYFLGYFKTIAYLVLKTEKMVIKETKCIFNNDAYHEYDIKWE